MVTLGSVTFKNSTGCNATIYYQVGDLAGNYVVIQPNATSNQIDGKLLNIDINTFDKSGNPVTKTYNFIKYLPNGVWVKDESPYTLKIVIDSDGSTLLLRIEDNAGNNVVEKRPYSKAFAANGFAATMTQQEVFNQLKAGISYEQASGYSISILKELLSDLEPVNYKWLTYNLADGGSWSARINGKSWGTGLNPTQLGSDEAYTQTVVELSQSIQAANRVSMLVDPYTPEAVEGLIMRVSEAIAAASKLPYMLRELNRVPTLQSLRTGMNATLHFYNNVNQQTDDQILIFLKPIGFSDDYNSFAWKVLNPGKGRHQEAILVNTFSGSIATFGSDVNDYSDAVHIDLGTANTITQIGHQSSTITDKTTNIDPNSVGLYNSGNERLSVIWYVNNDKVTETNNTSISTLNPGKTSTFQLDQHVYLMLAQEPIKSQTYKLQTYGNLQDFAIPTDATDVYFEVFTDPKDNVDKFRTTDKSTFTKLQQQA